MRMELKEYGWCVCGWWGGWLWVEESEKGGEILLIVDELSRIR